MERAFGSCAARVANGEKPLYSIRKALTLDRDEEKGGVWYSIKECLMHMPPLRPAPQPQKARGAEPRKAEPPAADAVKPAEAEEPAAAKEEAVESAEEELEKFIREHLPGP
jgi:hypothetical protein